MTTRRAANRSSSLLAVVLLVALSGCGITEAELRVFEDTRRYQHDLFGSLEACDAAQPDGFHFNGSQVVTFEQDGSATML